MILSVALVPVMSGQLIRKVFNVHNEHHSYINQHGVIKVTASDMHEYMTSSPLLPSCDIPCIDFTRVHCTPAI